jgi:hypothetical protein
MLSKLVNDNERKRLVKEGKSIPDNLKTINEKATPTPNDKRKVFTERLEKAKKYGWTVELVGSSYYLSCPVDFECMGYGTRCEEHTTLDGMVVIVPHYFWDDDILQVGHRR